MWLETEIRHVFAVSIVEYLDVGAVLEGRFTHFTPLRDAYFGEVGAIIESQAPNLSHRWGDSDAREAGATRESTAPNLRHRWWYGDARETLITCSTQQMIWNCETHCSWHLTFSIVICLAKITTLIWKCIFFKSYIHFFSCSCLNY